MTSNNAILELSLPLLLLLFFASGSADATNVIDSCWRRPSWAADRQQLALCSVGFAGKMIHNRGGDVATYAVTDPSDDPVHPRPGTLRHAAATAAGKVWITFAGDMQIRLERPLVVGSFTTIDGRGADVHIANGAGFLIEHAHDVIIHGLQFHNIGPTPPGPVLGPGNRVTDPGAGDGDAIRIVTSFKIWLDHNTLYSCHDGLLDVTRGSTGITVSNNWFRDHDKVMLLGHDDGFVRDKDMKVTVAFNRFGPNCIQRMPRIRHGYAHVVNNFYDGWRDYAMGGSMNPTIKSQGNLYVAVGNKEVIWKEDGPGRGTSWNLKSVNDAFINGASFRQVGSAGVSPHYKPDEAFAAGNPDQVHALTRDAGALRCHANGC